MDEVSGITVTRQEGAPAVRERPAGEEAAAQIRSILICRPNTRLGNNVLLTPLVQEIGRSLPQARIDLLTGFPQAAELFSGYAGMGTVHALPYRGARHPIRHVATVLRAARVRYDVVIDTDPQSWTSGFLTGLMRAPVKVGFLHGRKRRSGYVNVPFEGAPAHMGTFPVYLLRRALLGMDEERARADLPLLDLKLTAGELEDGRRQLAPLAGSGGGPVVALAAAATGAKQYDLDWWRGMARQVRARVPAARLVEIRPPSGAASFPELPGYSSRSLRQVAGVIAAADGFVCADGGLMHLGSASRCPTVGLFKVTDPLVYAPYGGGSLALKVRDEGADEVAAAVETLLARARRS